MSSIDIGHDRFPLIVHPYHVLHDCSAGIDVVLTGYYRKIHSLQELRHRSECCPIVLIVDYRFVYTGQMGYPPLRTRQIEAALTDRVGGISPAGDVHQLDRSIVLSARHIRVGIHQYLDKRLVLTYLGYQHPRRVICTIFLYPINNTFDDVIFHCARLISIPFLFQI